jgi:hypothetical protein
MTYSNSVVQLNEDFVLNEDRDYATSPSSQFAAPDDNFSSFVMNMRPYELKVSVPSR